METQIVYGLQWLMQTYQTGINAVSVDKMGLGKLETLQKKCNAFLMRLKFDLEVKGPFIVFIPLGY